MNLSLLLLAANVTLTWDPVTDAESYKLYVGIQSLKAGNPPLAFYPTTDTQYTVGGLDLGTRYFFVATALAAGGLESPYSNEVSYLSAPPPPETIWPGVAVPVRADAGADQPVELGVRFISDVSVKIVGIRFYKSAANTGIHVANLWNSLGIRLASATFTGETPAGWQEVLFVVPVVVTGGLTYTASYYCPNGHYAADWDFFLNQAADGGPMHAPANVNGVYRYGLASPFPDQVYRNTNYWVDVMFVQ